MTPTPEAVREALSFLERGYSGKGLAAEIRQAHTATIRAHFTALAAEVEGLRELRDFNNRAMDAIANDLRAAGCSFDSKRTPIVLNDRAEQAEAKLAACEADLRSLGGFAAFILQYNEDFIGDIDGGTLQDAAEKHGLLAPVEVTEPCGEGCNCAAYGEFPMDCYRRTPTMKRAVDAAIQGESDG